LNDVIDRGKVNGRVISAHKTINPSPMPITARKTLFPALAMYTRLVVNSSQNPSSRMKVV
jgi:hypothetical protein